MTIASRSPADWARTLEPYRASSDVRSWSELVLTLALFGAGCALLYAAWFAGAMVWYAMLLLPTAGVLVRLFLMQHDCGHHALFTSRRANDAVGRVLGVLTLTPYEHWRRAHAAHHATHGNLGRRGVGDIDVLTVAEYRARTPGRRLRYRLYRHPVVMFGIGPLFVFLLQNRLPTGYLRERRHWLSTMGTNLAAFALAALLVQMVGVHAFVAVQLPMFALAATIGVFLFFVQHQFEATTWYAPADWSFREAALAGSSHFALPGLLRWFTANVGLHHVHHLCSRIPFYRLPAVTRDHPELAAANRIGLLAGLGCVRLALWDEDTRRLVPFRDAACAVTTPASFAAPRSAAEENVPC